MKTILKNSRLSKISADNRLLLSNFASLSLLQATNFILPILLLPYLVRTLGVERFGLVAFAQAVCTYLVVFTDYGFNLSATREISVYRHDLKKVSAIFSAVLSTKLLLCLLSFVVLVTFVLLLPKLRQNWCLHLLSFSIVIGQALFPIWFFQGMERMKFITYISIIAKVLFTILVIFFIDNPADYLYVNLCLGLGGIFSGIFSLLIIRNYFSISFRLSNFRDVKRQLIDGWHIFISAFSINVYINSNLIILGFFTSQINVGYYSIAEKVIIATRQLLVVFSQVIYPRICQLAQISHQKLIDFIKAVCLPFTIFISCCCAAICLLAGQIVEFLCGQSLDEIVVLLRLFSIVPFIVVLNIPAYQVLLAHNYKSGYSKVLTAGAILSVILNIFLAYYFASLGTVMAIIITETFITIGLYLVIKKKLKYSLHS